MSSYVYLRVGGVLVDWGANRGYVDHRGLFGDRSPSRRAVELEDGSSGEEWVSVAPLSELVPRLELLGYTLDHARNHLVYLNDATQDELERIEELAPELIKFRVPRDNTTIELPELAFDMPWLCFDAYAALRLLAENPANHDASVVWEFADIIDGGWVELEDVTGPVGRQSRFLLITEGSTDSRIIRVALERIKPKILDFFDFIDMEDNYPFTGVGNLVNFVKGLVKIGSTTRAIAIFDNDGAGVDGFNKASGLKLPCNLRVMKLPSLPEFEQFPTLGPNGQFLADINGRAAAIECYLDFGDHTPVIQWTNFVEESKGNLGYWQGNLGRLKSPLQHAFEKARPEYDYSKLERVLDAIVEECCKMAGDLNRAAYV